MTRGGKTLHRAKSLGHNRANKSTVQAQRKALYRGLKGVRKTQLQGYFSQ